jgi:hypothetical protein
MTVGEVINMNDKSRRRGFWIGAISGLALGLGIGAVTAVFIILKFAHEIVGIYTAVL